MNVILDLDFSDFLIADLYFDVIGNLEIID